jgi:hypothetical protein
MHNHLVDDELAAQLTMPPECALPLQLLVINDRSVDDKLAAQLMMLPESILLRNARRIPTQWTTSWRN